MRYGIITAFDGEEGRTMDDAVAVGQAAEAAGFHSMLVPEHVVFFPEYESKYPYNESGDPGFGSAMGLFDPLFVLAAIASGTSTLRLGTGILILPQRNPVVLAQEIVALDHLSSGRFDLGIGVGWSAEEFEALGVPWPRRGARTDACLRAMVALWTEDLAHHESEFFAFANVVAKPKPHQSPHPPIVVGGQSKAALRRAATYGDGWYGWNLDPAGLAETLGELDAACEQAGRDPSTLTRKVGMVSPGDPDRILAYATQAADLGVDEVVLRVSGSTAKVTARLADWGAAICST